MSWLRILLISVLVFVFSSFIVVYALDSVNISYHVNPDQLLAIDISKKVGKLDDKSSFAVTEFPKVGNINSKDATLGIFEYSNKLDNTTDNAVITEKFANQTRKFNIIFNVGITSFVTNHNHRIGLGVASAIGIGVIITICTLAILHRSKSRFFDIIRTPDMDPSLSLFQFLVWTWVVIFSFILIYTIKILAGDTNLAGSVIPQNLLILMGISTAVPIVSTGISRAYYERDWTAESTVADAFKKNTDATLKKIRKENPIGNMLKENNKPTIARYQMFAWTFIGIFIYLFSLCTVVISNDQPQEIRKMSIPDVDITIVVLMGLSSTAFLGLKSVTNFMKIREVLPESVKAGGDMSIFGKNFGEESDTVWIGNRAIKSSDEPTKLIWSDERIDLKIPSDLEKGEYYIRVVKKGSSVKYEPKITVLPP